MPANNERGGVVGVHFENDLADRRATDKLALDSCWTGAIARHLAAGDDNGVMTPLRMPPRGSPALVLWKPLPKP